MVRRENYWAQAPFANCECDSLSCDANAGSRWTTADPVTGTTIRWAGSNGTSGTANEETEPLGQIVAIADPNTETSPGYENAARNSAFREW